MKYHWLSLAVAGSLAVPLTAQAGAKIKITDDSSIDLGFRLQSFYLKNDSSFVSPRDENEFRVRRARIRLKGNVTKYFSMFLQTEFSKEGTASTADMRLIDAYTTIKPFTWFQINAGELMAPASRQNTTSSGALMAWDRVTQNNKTLTWGTRSVGALQTRTLGFTNAGLKGEVDVRDLGVTLFGSESFGDALHGKYYIGVYQGARTEFDDSQRYAGRIQINLMDPEPGYFNASTYLGKKQTIGIGAAFDRQNDVARDVNGNAIDYKWYSLDVFTDYPLGPGSVTLEAGYNNLDLDDGGILVDSSGNSLSSVSAKQSQGDGYYVQGGYYIAGLGGVTGGWQPWFEYETWDADVKAGGYDSYRVGLSYYFKGHNANVKVGYERISPDGSSDPNVNTLGVGIFMTY